MVYDIETSFFFSVLENFAKRQCPEDEKEIWNQILHPVTLQKKSILIEVGEIPDEFYFIVRGLTRQYYIDTSGNEITRGFSYEGEFVCTEVLIQGSKSLFKIETQEECRLLAFRLSDLDRLRDSDFMKDAYIGALEQNVRRRLNRDAAFLMGDAMSRYEYFLMTNPEISERVKKIHLSSYLGMTPECLSRVRRKLKNQKHKNEL